MKAIILVGSLSARISEENRLKPMIEIGGKPVLWHMKVYTRGTVRGLHFQHPPHTETKFVSCLRRDSSAFLPWHGEMLSTENHRTRMIPEGYTHGFQSLSDDCRMLNFRTAAYRTEEEGGLNALDPRLAIRWPQPVTHRSPRDYAHAMIDTSFPGSA